MPTDDKVIPVSELKEIGRVQKLKPTEADFKGRPGYERYHVTEGPDGKKTKHAGEAPDGSYKWRYAFTPNDGHGKLTKEASMVGEMLRPFQRADAERYARYSSSPGDYGGGLPGKIMLAPRAISGYWCDGCGSRKSWCECAGDAEVGMDPRTGAGRDATPASGGTACP